MHIPICGIWMRVTSKTILYKKGSQRERAVTVSGYWRWMGETVTVLPVFNAMGDFVPIMVIFKGMRVRKYWLMGTPSNAIVRASKHHYINKELFVEFGQKFANFLATWNSTTDPRKHLLVMNEHGRHTYNIEFLTLMKEINTLVAACR